LSLCRDNLTEIGLSPLCAGLRQRSCCTNRVQFLTAFWLVIAASSAFADTLLLKNGREYSGVLVSVSAARVRFNIGRGVVRVFPVRDVDQIQFGDRIAKSTPRETPRA